MIEKEESGIHNSYFISIFSSTKLLIFVSLKEIRKVEITIAFRLLFLSDKMIFRVKYMLWYWHSTFAIGSSDGNANWILFAFCNVLRCAGDAYVRVCVLKYRRKQFCQWFKYVYTHNTKRRIRFQYDSDNVFHWKFVKCAFCTNNISTRNHLSPHSFCSIMARLGAHICSVQAFYRWRWQWPHNGFILYTLFM